MTPGERLKSARLAAGYGSAAAAAEALGVPQPTYTQHENNARGLTPARAEQYARRFRVDVAWLMFGRGEGLDRRPDDKEGAVTPEAMPIASNVLIGEALGPSDPNERTPVYGQAMGGDDGGFVFNGEKIDDILTPPALRGVRGAYAVEFVGTSMEPRYFAGERGHVHPSRAVRSGDFVVAQIRAKVGEPPNGFVKQFVRMNSEKLVLAQFNPPMEIEFPREDVVSVHKIVGTG